MALPATILMYSSANSVLRIEAHVETLEQFKSGALQGHAGLKMSGEAALKIIGAAGPFLLDLIHLPRFFGTVGRGGIVETGLPKEPYIAVEPNLHVLDDPES
jgi:hypothetical protein